MCATPLLITFNRRDLYNIYGVNTFYGAWKKCEVQLIIFIFTTLYNMIMMLTIMSFFFLGFCFLEMEKIKPVYAPKDFFEVHIIIAETTYEQRTGFTQS